MKAVCDQRYSSDTVIDGTIAALKEQKTQYTANAGIIELQEAIARQAIGADSLSVEADRVIVNRPGHSGDS